jgi:hypothetical protein
MCAIAGLYAFAPSAPPADRAELRTIRDHMAQGHVFRSATQPRARAGLSAGNMTLGDEFVVRSCCFTGAPSPQPPDQAGGRLSPPRGEGVETRIIIGVRFPPQPPDQAGGRLSPPRGKGVTAHTGAVRRYGSCSLSRSRERVGVRAGGRARRHRTQPFCRNTDILAHAAANPARGTQGDALDAIGAAVRDSIAAHPQPGAPCVVEVKRPSCV